MITLQVGKNDVELPEKLSIGQYQKLQTTDTLGKDPVEFLTAITGLDKKEIRYANKSDMDFVYSYIVDHYIGKPQRELKLHFEYDGVEYGLHTDLKTINYGGWVDIEFLITDGVEKNIHKILAIFYRPITSWKEGKVREYVLEEYDHDDMEIRAKIFLNIPVEIYFGFVDFFLRVASKSTENMKASLEYQRTKEKAMRRLMRITPKFLHSKLFPGFTGPA